MADAVNTTCPYCGVGCGVLASRTENGAVTIAGDPNHPANFGRLCSKGSALGETLGQDGRLLHPQIGGRRADWSEALSLVARNFRETIEKHGPDSVAFYLSGQLLTEDYYIANKLAKGFIGTANIDTNSRLCMASSVAGHRRAFGSDTVPGTYEDLELADLVVLAGSNMAWCHPVLYQRLAAAKRTRPDMKVVVIDPRRTATCEIADMHLAIAPDGDVALFLGLFAHLARNGAIDKAYIAAHTNGFEEALACSASLTGEVLSAHTGLSAQEVQAFYRLFASTEKTITCYSQGVNQSASGTDKVNAILNCHLATGRIGRPGTGPFSLTGQPNAMGGREVGGLANMLAAHMDIENAEHRACVQRFWQSPAVADKPGLKAVDMFRAVADGRIKAIWIMATNPVVSMPEADIVRTALEQCPFVVVSDTERFTDTTLLADVLLPSLGWAEKDGTVTNSERRISRQRSFLPAPGEARADWQQLTEMACHMGFAEDFRYETSAEIFAEHAALSGFENDGQRDFDIGAYADLDGDGYARLRPFQWPQPVGRKATNTRFFADGGFYHLDGKARFIATSLPEKQCSEQAYPFTLNTGRIRDQWHTMTRSGRSPRLAAHIGEPFAEIHPLDALALDIDHATLVTLESPHGQITARALLTDRQPRGSVFVPMHWNDQYVARARVNTLVPACVDRFSGQPSSKNAAVAVRPVPAKAYGFAVSMEKPDLRDAPYWAVARTAYGWRAELAFERDENWIDWCRRAFALPEDAHPLGYTDQSGEQTRLAFFASDRMIAAFFIAPQPVNVARDWMAAQLGSLHDDIRKRVALVAGRPGNGVADPGATVCACFGVGVNQIAGAIRQGCTDVEAIGQKLKAGTNCGSCRSEIGRVIDASLIAAAE
ncbi:MAG: molybdopterin-dependent oxidoreductase [Phyllobacterium sp.]